MTSQDFSASDVSYVRDTIAARATAPGIGGVGIIRISGPLVSDIAEALLGKIPSERHATYTTFRESDQTAIDSGLALYFQSPDSFTGEDVLELQGHGGPIVLDMLLSRIVGLGARIALPGEFSQRAFLNDKIDLAQAEAIADLIHSGSRQAARSAMRSLKGEFSRRVNTLVSSVILLRVYVEAAIDFPEEEIDFISDERVSIDLDQLVSTLDELLRTAGDGALLNEGADVVLLGKPNAGKSSLMNQLTGEETSIVTDIPGTTRDVIDQQLEIDGIPLRLLDTAGIRDSENTIEAEGVRRALAAKASADLIIAIVDTNQTLEEMLSDIRELDLGERCILVGNKIDLAGSHSALGPDALLSLGLVEDIVPMSAMTGEGLPALKAAIKQTLGFNGSESTFAARSRHIAALKRAQASLASGHKCLSEHQAGELLAEELKDVQRHLSEITGEFSSDDLLGEIFSSFCIGK
ncbi:MAG: tRNA modification GTPase [Candidatus Azotimanducaceae bacterium]|jgi:tRNA modification GTPase